MKTRRSRSLVTLAACIALPAITSLAAAWQEAKPRSTTIYDSLLLKDEVPAKPGQADAPKDKPKEKRIVAMGKRYAIVVGVGEAHIPGYQLEKLPECITDATNLAAALEKSGYQCTLLCEKGIPPTKAAVLKALKDVCANLEATDQVLFYGSTHGGVIGGEPSLAMQDDKLELRDVKKAFAESKALVRVILLDCCRNQKGFPTVSSEFRDIHTILSCRPDEESITGDNGMSVFTEVLIEALDGCKADRVKDGRLELDEVLYYLDEHVPTRADQAERGHSQNPTRSVVDPRSVNPILAVCDSKPVDIQAPQPVGVEGPVVRAPRNDLIISSALAGKVSIGQTPTELYQTLGTPKDDELTLSDSGQGLLLYSDVPNEGDTTFVFFEKSKVSAVMAFYKKPCTGAFDAKATRAAITDILDGQPIAKLESLVSGWDSAKIFAKFGCPSTYLSTNVGRNKTIAAYMDVPTIGTELAFILEDGKVSGVKLQEKKP